MLWIIADRKGRRLAEGFHTVEIAVRQARAVYSGAWYVFGISRSGRVVEVLIVGRA